MSKKDEIRNNLKNNELLRRNILDFHSGIKSREVRDMWRSVVTSRVKELIEIAKKEDAKLSSLEMLTYNRQILKGLDYLN